MIRFSRITSKFHVFSRWDTFHIPKPLIKPRVDWGFRDSKPEHGWFCYCRWLHWHFGMWYGPEVNISLFGGRFVGDLESRRDFLKKALAAATAAAVAPIPGVVSAAEKVRKPVDIPGSYRLGRGIVLENMEMVYSDLHDAWFFRGLAHKEGKEDQYKYFHMMVKSRREIDKNLLDDIERAVLLSLK